MREQACERINISTHSLTKRLTFVLDLLSVVQGYFNSQPHEEADIPERSLQAVAIYFNSQPHEEADGGSLKKRS